MLGSKKGDVVRLNSGGPDMCVDSIYCEPEARRCNLVWFDDQGNLQRTDGLHEATLTLRGRDGWRPAE